MRGEAADRNSSGTRPCWSKGIGGCDAFMKLCVLSSGCKFCPGKGEPTRAGSKLGDGLGLRPAMRRHVSVCAVGLRPRNLEPSRRPRVLSGPRARACCPVLPLAALPSAILPRMSRPRRRSTPYTGALQRGRWGAPGDAFLSASAKSLWEFLFAMRGILTGLCLALVAH